jgi:RNA polymerase sigma factor (sigma-70 family)
VVLSIRRDHEHRNEASRLSEALHLPAACSPARLPTRSLDDWPVVMTSVDNGAIDSYLANRDLLFGVAYRLLGRVEDAEDVLQEAWLRWTNTAQTDIENPKAFLIRITTNLALDRLRRIKARRETYTGPWLPEPLLTSDDASHQVELAESASMAMMVVLETLSPLERAVFVLHEAFAVSYDDLATIFGRTPGTIRQLASRARHHVEERRPRFDSDVETRRELTEQFLKASANGDLKSLLTILAPGVELVSDGGGLVRSPLLPVFGAENVARFVLAVQERESLEESNFTLTEVNGGPGLVVGTAEVPAAIVTLDVLDGLIAKIYLIANPNKFGGLSPRPAVQAPHAGDVTP